MGKKRTASAGDDYQADIIKGDAGQFSRFAQANRAHPGQPTRNSLLRID